MQLKHINNCTDYFNYGLLDDTVIVDSFSWDEGESVDLLPILEYIKHNSTKTYMYLITSRFCMYPVGTIDKYLKLWKGISQKYNMHLVRKSEKREELRRFCVFWGIAEFLSEQLEVAMEILQNDFMHSCIILSDQKLNLEQSLDKMMDISPQKTDYNLKFVDLINLVCEQNEIITSIIGCNGSTINYFYSSRGE